MSQFWMTYGFALTFGTHKYGQMCIDTRHLSPSAGLLLPKLAFLCEDRVQPECGNELCLHSFNAWITSPCEQQPTPSTVLWVLI